MNEFIQLVINMLLGEFQVYKQMKDNENNLRLFKTGAITRTDMLEHMKNNMSKHNEHQVISIKVRSKLLDYCIDETLKSQLVSAIYTRCNTLTDDEVFFLIEKINFINNYTGTNYALIIILRLIKV